MPQDKDNQILGYNLHIIRLQELHEELFSWEHQMFSVEIIFHQPRKLLNLSAK